MREMDPGWGDIRRQQADSLEALWDEQDELPATDSIIDGRGRAWWMAVCNATEELGYPVFVRSDYAAGKHLYEETCYLRSDDRLVEQIAALLEDNEFNGLTYSALALREYIPPAAEFRAFHGRLPIGYERRLFVEDGRVVCWHPYWPPEAIIAPDRPDWEGLLINASLMSEDEIELLIGYAERIGERLEGYWSIDFMMSERGEWYFIDCALGHDSWHPACEVVERHPEYDTQDGRGATASGRSGSGVRGTGTTNGART